ncbi:MAG: hypothetical protein UU34_C0001G0133 [Candidatus Curtissbacteria bacterium GW2011_GWA1_41_11]|uniref:Glycosyltransferase RgtA/B/C/D-like domain-containing protein n=1 Tax=Candidatus Curtissbacteria bacterium GW2011_GWA1_41_11 TaxID=1618409 RepID=A0A0G0UKU6_9BACT|nr:MAG: hypothetical protein UU34_C0001G0133 [Candidatus Curtissbacteria bacterium GW2011_GWA1_41_11]
MKKEVLIFILIAIATIFIYRQSFFNFFAQDDFILTSEFSQNSLLVDFKNALSPPRVTHWRPIHNLYFLIAGNIFNKNYFGYHLLTFTIHITAVFLIFKIIHKTSKNLKVAFVASFIYAIHPAHFVTLFWISGAATTIGFLFLLLAFLFYLEKKALLSLSSFICSLLASEAMLVGISLFLIYQFLFRKKEGFNRQLIYILSISVLFAIVRFLFLTPETTFDAYKFKIGLETLSAIKYYVLRIVGFAEISGDLLISVALVLFLVTAGFLLNRTPESLSKRRLALFGIITIVVGLFPFILIPDLLSPHYMNISIFGFSIILSLAISNLNFLKFFLLLSLFFIISLVNVGKTYENNWVINRSLIASEYIRRIENTLLPRGSTIFFYDSDISSSKEAYISLGEGKAINFWFKNKNYQVCFDAFEDCNK